MSHCIRFPLNPSETTTQEPFRNVVRSQYCFPKSQCLSYKRGGSRHLFGMACKHTTSRVTNNKCNCPWNHCAMPSRINITLQHPREGALPISSSNPLKEQPSDEKQPSEVVQPSEGEEPSEVLGPAEVINLLKRCAI